MRNALRSELPHLVVLSVLLGVAAVVWPWAPERLPVHWNLAGEVDRYGGRFEGLLAVPLMAVGMYALLLFLPWIDPRRDNFRRFEGSYQIIRWSLTLFLTVLYAVMLASGFGIRVDVGLCVSLLMCGLFVTLGFTLADVQPNWFVGVRTPWTLSSDVSWQKTHRAAKWVFVALGVSFVPLGIWKTPWMLAAVIVTAFIGIGWLVVYSYRVWKSDQMNKPQTA